MSGCAAVAGEFAGGVERARIGRRGELYQRVILTIVMALGTPAFAHAQAGNDWTGKRVVQKSGDFRLRIDDEPVERSGKTIEFYQPSRTTARPSGLI